MKKSRLLSLLPLICAFALTSCDLLSNLSFNTPKRKSSNEEPDSALVNSRSSIEEPPSLIEPERPMSSSSYTSSYHKHNFSDWVVVQDATCLEDGIKERYCVECGEVQQETFKGDHVWGNWETYRVANCVETGIEGRECAVCHMREERMLATTGHTWSEWEIIQEPTCTNSGYQRHYCLVCGHEENVYLPEYGHSYDTENIEWTQYPTCTQVGIGHVTCSRCGQRIELNEPAQGHNYKLISGGNNAAAGEAKVRIYQCTRCNDTSMSFSAADVSDASKQHLVFEDNWDSGELGAHFWGRPIGNAMALDDMGVSINQTNGECVYCSTETGDFFEYVFTLTTEQAVMLSTCRLYCDAKPADYLNGTDFWAYGRSNDEWTPGYYIDGADNHVQYNEDGTVMMVRDHARATISGVEGTELNTVVPMGKRVEDYRYVLYVDDQVVDFDPDISVPTHGNGSNMTREEFVLPYTFHLHQGLNKIRLCMAGGYRSTFYNFIFRPYVEPTPVTVNESSLEVREGKTAQITSSMSGLMYKSSSTSVCTVDASGLVTGVKAGTATITVSKEGNYKDAKVAVTVLEKEGVVSLDIAEALIAPEGGVTLYNSASSGAWLRNFQNGATLTYTFQSEFAGLFDIQMGLRGSGIALEENIAIKVNGVDVVLEGTVSTSYTAVEYIVGQAYLVVGENTMVITAIAENNLYLKTIKLMPHQYAAMYTWSCEALELNRTDSGWADSRNFGGETAFKFNKAGNVTVTYQSASAQKVMLQLKIAVKVSNRAKTGFWKQDGNEKTRITVNGAVVDPGAEPDFSNITDSGVSDNGYVSIPEWFNIAEVDLVAGENTIQVEFISGGYAYYLGGIALAK